MKNLETKTFKKKRRNGELVVGYITKKIGEKLVTQKRSFRKAKCLPKGCRTAKRICIVCLKTVIHKNDSNYDSKICKACENP